MKLPTPNQIRDLNEVKEEKKKTIGNMNYFPKKKTEERY
jgi:hypothetical protein